MKSKKQTLNQSIRKYALLPIIATFLFFYDAFSMKAQLNTVQKDTVNIQDTHAMQKSNATLIDFVDVQPQFPGGDKALLKFLINNIRYPEEAIKDTIEGRVVLRFIIKSDGSVDDVAVVKGLYPACDSEAVRVVKMMPNWIPGQQNGNPINTHYSLPVTFRLPTDSAVVMPQFPGGNKALLNFLGKNVNYPFDAMRNNIQGRVTVNFLVMADGTISDVKIVQSVHPSLDKEAIRVVKSMPKWIPGTKNGEPAEIYFTLPVIFKMASSTRVWGVIRN